MIRHLTNKAILSGVGEELVLKRVRAASLNTLLRRLDSVDLVGLDIQGWELVNRHDRLTSAAHSFT